MRSTFDTQPPPLPCARIVFQFGLCSPLSPIGIFYVVRRGDGLQTDMGVFVVADDLSAADLRVQTRDEAHYFNPALFIARVF